MLGLHHADAPELDGGPKPFLMLDVDYLGPFSILGLRRCCLEPLGAELQLEQLKGTKDSVAGIEYLLF